MTIKMIAVDMDGTFLRNDSTYDRDLFKQIFFELKKRNIKFILASGNTYKQLQSKFDNYQDEFIYVAENGSFIVEGNNELKAANINNEDVKNIIAGLKTMDDVLCWTCTKSQSYALNSMDAFYFEKFLPYFPGVKQIDDFTSIKEPIIKFALYLPNGNIEQRINDLVKITSDEVHVLDSGYDCVDIISKDASKGNAIDYLMERYHLTKDEVMAFGDASNDEDMLKRVTYGYAMDNASKEFIDKFNYLAPSNENQGVLEVIRYYLDTNEFLNLK